MAGRKEVYRQAYKGSVEPPVVVSRNGPLTLFELRLENRTFEDTGGISQNNRDLGFRPAYRNIRTGQTVMSRYANGEPAPVHVLDGLPDEWVVARDPEGSVSRVIATVVAGFVHNGSFYSREAAARLLKTEKQV